MYHKTKAPEIVKAKLEISRRKTAIFLEALLKGTHMAVFKSMLNKYS